MTSLRFQHTDVVAGAAEAELLRIVSECINLFPGVNAQQFDIYISQSTRKLSSNVLFKPTDIIQWLRRYSIERTWTGNAEEISP